MLGGDNMKIFTNESVQESMIDFTRWETTNGDYISITDVGSGYIERSMDMLEQFIERYPNHVNQRIWERYRQAFEDEVLSREDYMREQRRHAKEREAFYQTASMIG